jgi:hypothetical protein
VEGGNGEDFRAEGLEWEYEIDYGDYVEMYTEVGRLADRYYGDTTAEDCYLDPNFCRPDWSAGQWQVQWSRPIKHVKSCT